MDPAKPTFWGSVDTSLPELLCQRMRMSSNHIAEQTIVMVTATGIIQEQPIVIVASELFRSRDAAMKTGSSDAIVLPAEHFQLSLNHQPRAGT